MTRPKFSVSVQIIHGELKHRIHTSAAIHLGKGLIEYCLHLGCFNLSNFVHYVEIIDLNFT